jgi:hypothetical protein
MVLPFVQRLCGLCRKFWSRMDSSSIHLPICLATIGVAAWFALNIHVFGFRFWSIDDKELDYAMGLLWWGIFAFGILVFAREDRWMLMAAWIGKFFVALIAMLFYEYYYSLDAGEYHLIAKTGQYGAFAGVDFRADLLPSFRRPSVVDEVDDLQLGASAQAANWVRVLVLVGSVTGPYYHALKVAFSFLGLLGVWYFYRAVVIALRRPYPPAFYLLAFFPSIIFWSSILGKDPFQFFFTGLYAYGGAMLLVQGRLAAVWFAGGGLLGAYLIRPWLSIMGGVTLLVAVLLGGSRPLRVGAWLLVGASLLLWSPQQNETLLRSVLRLDMEQIQEFVAGPTQVVDTIQMRAQGFSRSTQATGGSGVDLSDIGASSQAGLPLAMFSGLFRPLPFDITNPFTALAAVENTAVLLMALVAVSRVRFAYLRNPLVLWAALYSLTWAALYGYIVMANFGSGVRYKLQVWPFLLMLLISLAHREGRAWLNSWASDRNGSADH